VVLAKMHSFGFFGGNSISRMRDSGISSAGYFTRSFLSSAIVAALCEGDSISASFALAAE
jgi:hypothetical protein